MPIYSVSCVGLVVILVGVSSGCEVCDETLALFSSLLLRSPLLAVSIIAPTNQKQLARSFMADHSGRRLKDTERVRILQVR